MTQSRVASRSAHYEAEEAVFVNGHRRRPTRSLSPTNQTGTFDEGGLALNRLRRSLRLAVLPFLLFLRIIGWQTEALGAQLSLSWNASSTNELGFSIERSTGTTGAFGEIARTGPGVTTYSDPGLADATTYCYRVRAFNATTYSDYSNPACATNVSLGLSLSRHTVSPGDTVQVSVTEANTGEATSVELYFGILVPLALSSTYGCPDGDAVVFIADGFSKVLTPCVNTASPASVEPLYSDVSLPTAMPATTTLDLVSFTWPTEVPEGMYTFVIFAAPAGTYANGGLSADVISAVASDSLQASP